MKKWIALPLAALLTFAGVIAATADYTVKDGGGTTQTIFAFVCVTTKICPAHVPIDSAGGDMTDTTNHRLNTNTNTADGANVAVGAKADTAWTGSGSGSVIALLKAIYSAATGAVPAGTNIIGKVGIDQTTPGTTNGVQVNAALPAGTNLIGNAGTGLICAGCTASYGSATGTTSATSATLAATASVTQYVCGFSIRANATAAATGNATLSDGTKTYNFTQWTAPNASGVGVVEEVFPGGCRPASAVNTAWTLTSAAPGTGGVVSVTIWGFYK